SSCSGTSCFRWWAGTRCTPRQVTSGRRTCAGGTPAGARAPCGRWTTPRAHAGSAPGAWIPASPTARERSGRDSRAQRGGPLALDGGGLALRAGQRLGHRRRTATDDQHLARGEVLRLPRHDHHHVRTLLQREVGAELQLGGLVLRAVRGAEEHLLVVDQDVHVEQALRLGDGAGQREAVRGGDHAALTLVYL